MLAIGSRSKETKKDPLTAIPRQGTYLQFSCPGGHSVHRRLTSHFTPSDVSYCDDCDRETFPGSVRVEYK